MGYGDFFTLVMSVSAVLGLSGRLNPWIALLLAGFSAWQLVFFGPSVWISLRFWKAKTAAAVTLKVASIGRIKWRGIFSVKVLLEVQPTHEPPFQAEMVLPVQEKNLARAIPGEVIQVKYLAEDHSQVIYHQP